MKLQFIACKVMSREAEFCVSRSVNEIDTVFMEQGLHTKPDKLRTEVQKTLEHTKNSRSKVYDAIVLGYGLCCNGIVGLKAAIPIVVPRAHDCITILLGSKERYRHYFDKHKGVYWFSSGWIETGTQPGKERFEETLKEYIEKYGHDNARFLMEAEQNWMAEYNRAVYIDWGFPQAQQEKQYTKKCADFMGWEYEQLEGDSSLMQRLLDGQWDEDDFLIVKPGQRIAEDITNEGIIKAQ